MAVVKVLLAGHEGSKKILPASSYLIDKYLPKGFQLFFLNYGKFDGFLFGGNYVELDSEQRGGSSAWSQYLRRHLSRIADDYVVFGLDDYLLSAPMNRKVFDTLFRAMVDDAEIVAARLCQSDFYTDRERFIRKDGLIELTAEAAYSVTTQWSIWRREALIDVMASVLDPWSFEMAGSVYLNSTGWKVIGSRIPALVYPDESCLSSKWQGVRTRGTNPADIDEILRMGHLKREDLC